MAKRWQFFRNLFRKLFGKAPPPPARPERRDDWYGDWRGVCGVAAGDKHLRANPPVPCQDAAKISAGAKIRPCAFVADGAGSAALSHLGARETVVRLSHLAAALEDINAELLDGEEAPPAEKYQAHARRFVRHAAASVGYLAGEKQKPFKQFHCTLLMAIAGLSRILWIKVGDGHIVTETRAGKLKTEGATGKGEYANITEFITENAAATEQYGIIPAKDISGIALMTDGAAEKLVSLDGKKVAPRIGKMLADVRSGNLKTDDLEKFLADPAIWKPPGYTGDDKGLALLARGDNTEK